MIEPNLEFLNAAMSSREVRSYDMSDGPLRYR